MAELDEGAEEGFLVLSRERRDRELHRTRSRPLESPPLYPGISSASDRIRLALCFRDRREQRTENGKHDTTLHINLSFHIHILILILILILLPTRRTFPIPISPLPNFLSLRSPYLMATVVAPSLQIPVEALPNPLSILPHPDRTFPNP